MQAPSPVIDLEDLRRISGPVIVHPKDESESNIRTFPRAEGKPQRDESRITHIRAPTAYGQVIIDGGKRDS